MNRALALKGILFQYNESGSIAFDNGVESKMCIILIGGLGDNIASLPYSGKLNELCLENGIRLIIPQLRSQPEYMLHPIEDDIEDIEDLMKHVQEKALLIGHSTGCQDILLYLKSTSFREKVAGAVLQAPVSDTEANDCSGTEDLMETTEKYLLENGEVWLTERFTSLLKKYGKEDLFSSYLENEAFEQWKSYTKILTVLSEKDEFAKMLLTEKFKLMGDVKVIKDADHSISGREAQETFIKHVKDFISELMKEGY
ncbi:hypothetical protein ENBRE01_0727 [Enteropsectra breve]|nr:hypothetical protein ENBRE01_0727 [Enteropsectra breve]